MAKTLNLGAVRAMTQGDNPPNLEEAARQLGIGQDAFRVARNVVYLMDEEMTPAEWAEVAKAAQHVSRYEISAAKEIIEPIMLAHFGDGSTTGSTRVGGPKVARAVLVARFDDAVNRIIDTLSICTEIKVPFLPEARRLAVAAELLEAITKADVLLETIKRGGNQHGL